MKSCSNLFIGVALVASSTINCYAAVSPGYSTPDGKWTVICVSDREIDGSEEALASCKTERTAKGSYGLMMSNIDLANLDSPGKGVKYSSVNLAIGPNAQSDSNGVANTQAIINAFPNDTRENNAAKLCSEYLSPNQQNPQKPIIQGYLGAKDELAKMYEYASNPNNNLIGRNCQGDKSKEGGAHCLIGGLIEEDKIYRSSTECADASESSAWNQYFSDGYQHNWHYKGRCLGVRALGVFNPSTLKLFNALKYLELEQKYQNLSMPRYKIYNHKKCIRDLCQTTNDLTEGLEKMAEIAFE